MTAPKPTHRGKGEKSPDLDWRAWDFSSLSGTAAMTCWHYEFFRERELRRQGELGPEKPADRKYRLKLFAAVRNPYQAVREGKVSLNGALHQTQG